MSGNVLEWCWDWYSSDYYSHSPQLNPKGPDSGPGRVLRGGGWNGSSHYVRVASRSWYARHNCSSWLGFRILRTR